MHPALFTAAQRLLAGASAFGKGEGWSGGTMGPSLWGQFNSPEASLESLAATPDKRAPEGPPMPSPMDRLRDSFAAFDQPKAVGEPQVFPQQRQAAPGGPVTQAAPGGPVTQAAAQEAPMHAVAPRAAPGAYAGAHGASSEPVPDPMGFFMRNALLQRDRDSGSYLNEAEAARALRAPVGSLFG